MIGQAQVKPSQTTLNAVCSAYRILPNEEVNPIQNYFTTQSGGPWLGLDSVAMVSLKMRLHLCFVICEPCIMIVKYKSHLGRRRVAICNLYL